jgi:hypothetical protein
MCTKTAIQQKITSGCYGLMVGALWKENSRVQYGRKISTVEENCTVQYGRKKSAV